MKTLFETATQKVFLNPTNEVFVENKKSGKCIRIDTVGTNISISISKGGNHFVHKFFIRKYCELDGINEVMVEYEEILGDNEYKLKLRSDNTIITKKAKDSYTAEEVRDLLYEALTYSGEGAFNMGCEHEEALKYINNYL